MQMSTYLLGNDVNKMLTLMLIIKVQIVGLDNFQFV